MRSIFTVTLLTANSTIPCTQRNLTTGHLPYCDGQHMKVRFILCIEVFFNGPAALRQRADIARYL